MSHNFLYLTPSLFCCLKRHLCLWYDCNAYKNVDIIHRVSKTLHIFFLFIKQVTAQTLRTHRGWMWTLSASFVTGWPELVSKRTWAYWLIQPSALDNWSTPSIDWRHLFVFSPVEPRCHIHPCTHPGHRHLSYEAMNGYDKYSIFIFKNHFIYAKTIRVSKTEQVQ